MTREEAIKMLKAKLECMTRDVSGSDDDCNCKLCGECPLNYEQGNMGEQKEYLRMSIEALEQEPKTGHWIPTGYDGYADGNPVWDEWECSECGCEHNGDEDTLTAYCPDCGADMRGEQE